MAAWIFAGYSPLEKEQTGKIIRLADKQEIPFGCIEFREAAKEQKRIKRQLISRVKIFSWAGILYNPRMASGFLSAM